MRILFCAALMQMLMFQSASAEQHSFGDNCAYISVVSELIMENRQLGVSLERMMGTASDNDILREITLDAYSKMRYPYEPDQQREIEDFRDRWTLSCYQAQ